MAEDTEPALPSPSDDEPGEQLPLIELDTLVNQPPSQRKRLVQIGLALAALVVVFATFWGVVRPKAPPASAPHILPTEPPPTLLITSNVNYGTITINGQKQRGAPPLEVAMHTQPPYQITLDAPPFQSSTCTFPGGCGVSGIGLDTNNQAVRSANLAFSAASLPLNQQSQVNSLVSQAISVQQEMAVPAGASVVTQLAHDGTISGQQAAEPLQATALLVSTAPPSSQFGVSCFGVICIDSLGGAGVSPSSSGHLWQVSSFVALRWRFTTAAGAVVGEVTYPVSEEISVSLTYDAATGWQVAPQPSGQRLVDQLPRIACGTGAEMLQVQQARYLSGEGWNVSILHQQGTAGCALSLEQNNVDQGHFVWRFGVLLAADALAHSTLPTLPIASPDDLAAVGG